MEGIIFVIGLMFTLMEFAFWGFFIFIFVKIIKTVLGKNKIDANNPNNQYYTKRGDGNVTVSYVPTRNDHDHAYEHKVEPIVEVSVHERVEERKEAYLERKQQMREDLPKTSYSKMEEASNGYVVNDYCQKSYNNYGSNGDTAPAYSSNEETIICKYCGAQNIVPKSRTKEYNCYFCREVI